MNTLQTFSFNNFDTRIVLINDQPWWIAKDVCSVLGIANVPDAVSALDQDEKLISPLPISGQYRDVNIINESGLYKLVFRSNKPEAKVFRKWVTSEVLPQIRKTGQYQPVPADPIEQVLLLAAKLTETAKQVLEERSKNLALTHQINEQAPKVEAFDTFLDATNTQTITDCAKALGIGRDFLFEYLRLSGMLFKEGQRAIQTYVDRGWFDHREATFTDQSTGEKKIKIQCRVTAKGIDNIRKHIEMDGGIDAVIAIVRANRKKAA